jgi:hypothetical protein
MSPLTSPSPVPVGVWVAESLDKEDSIYEEVVSPKSTFLGHMQPVILRMLVPLRDKSYTAYGPERTFDSQEESINKENRIQLPGPLLTRLI